MTALETTTMPIRMETDCCPDFAEALYLQLSTGNYGDVSLMPMPRDVMDWREGRKTARKRADRCERRGYLFRPIFRHFWTDDIYAVNISASHRQGRPMAAGYLQRPSSSPLPTYRCARHAIRDYAVFIADMTLVAYLYLYRCGDLALVSSILGHAAYLEDEIMWLLWQGMVASESAIDPSGVIVYNRHDSGNDDGLPWWKERVGLRETAVEWLP